MDWTHFWTSLWLIVEIFFFFAYLLVLFHIIGDLFRDSELGGFAKALWVFFLIVFPLLTALVYLIARGPGMARRQGKQIDAAQTAADQYIRDVAGGVGPAQEIEAAARLLADGKLTQAEYDQLKTKALAR